jgi:hypothetical protein
MRTSIFFIIVCLFQANAFAGTCNNGSLLGAYNYEFSGVQPYNTTSGILSFSNHDAGRINFNGTGFFNIGGVEIVAGRAVGIRSSGNYSVSTACTASGTFTTNTGQLVSYWIYLDQMDDVPATRLAYHATMAIKTSAGVSASGTLTRVIGKFQ